MIFVYFIDQKKMIDFIPYILSANWIWFNFIVKITDNINWVISPCIVIFVDLTSRMHFEITHKIIKLFWSHRLCFLSQSIQCFSLLFIFDFQINIIQLIFIINRIFYKLIYGWKSIGELFSDFLEHLLQPGLILFLIIRIDNIFCNYNLLYYWIY